MSTLERRIVSHSAFVVDTRGPIAHCFARTGAQAHVRLSCDSQKAEEDSLGRPALHTHTHGQATRVEANESIRGLGAEAALLRTIAFRNSISG